MKTARLEAVGRDVLNAERQLNDPFMASVRRLWVSVLKHEWSTLLIVPASSGLAASELGKALTSVATRALGTAPLFVDVTGADLAVATHAAQQLRESPPTLKRIVVCDAPWENEAAVAAALACDAAVIGVRLGRTTSDELRKTVRDISPVPVIGSVLLEGSDE